MNKHLPNEVLLYIFSLLNPSDQLNCQQVCQTWHSLARRIFYRQVNVNSQNLLQLLKCFDGHHFAPFQYIQSLSITEYPYANNQRTLTQEEFIRLLRYCSPRHFKLSLDSIYWNYLQDFEFDQLDYLPPRRLPKRAMGYYQTLYRLSHRLSRLVVHASCDDWILDEFGHLFNYLGHFPHLQQLSITAGSARSKVPLDLVLKKCVRLTHLVYHLDQPWQPLNRTAYPTLRELDIYLARGEHFDYLKRFTHLNRLKLRLFIGRQSNPDFLQDLFCWVQRIPDFQIMVDIEGVSFFRTEYDVYFDVQESGYERTCMEWVPGMIRYRVTYKGIHPCVSFLEKFETKNLYLNGRKIK
ncbi:hypothetical protein G6F56_008332 [Rhizopus delemar]|nr:hypothetical protein G6F56_008332 [Rhizopus delemar]